MFGASLSVVWDNLIVILRTDWLNSLLCLWQPSVVVAKAYFIIPEV